MGAVVVTYPAVGPITQNFGHHYYTAGFTLHLSSSYATGGDTITPAQVGYGAAIYEMWVKLNTGSPTSIFLFLLNTATVGVYTIQAFTAAAVPGLTTGLGEVTAATDLSAVIFGASFVGV